MTNIRPDNLIADLVKPLARWLPAQRWFGAKGREIISLRPARVSTVIDGDPGLVHALVTVDGSVNYQLLIGVRAVLPEQLTHAAIATADGVRTYEAAHDSELMGQVLDLIVANADRGGLRFRAEPNAELETGLRARPIGVEQSNTSVTFGQSYILKVYRRPTQGSNRDIDLHRTLHAAGSTHIAPPLGVIEGELDGEPIVLGFLQQFLPDAVEGWATATASVRDLLAEADLHADEVGGDFAGEAKRLGTAVAEVHADLAATLGSERVGPATIDAEVDAMHSRLDAALDEVPALRDHADVLRAAFDTARTVDSPIEIQQVHGDLHLGQVMRSTRGWVLIDFEGEPAAPPERRIAPRSPLHDVAGMLRSFDYAAFHLLAGIEDDRQRLVRAAEWSDRNRTAFCEGYATVGDDPRANSTLLRAFELDKAVYEVAYEHHNRPEWLAVPLAALRRETYRVA